MPIMIWGHRGHRYHRLADRFPSVAHENSLRAYEETLQLCNGIECDIVQSRQGTPFLIHDTLFDGIVHYEFTRHLDAASVIDVNNRFIYQMKDDEIGNLRLKDGQAIPRLRQLLERMQYFPKRFLNLELKGPHVTDVTIRVVEKAIQDNLIKPQQIIFSSHNFPALRYLRDQVGTRYKIGILYEPGFGGEFNRMYPNWPNAEQDAFYMPITEENLRRVDVQEINPDFFNLAHTETNSDVINMINHYFPKAKVILWTMGESYPDENDSLLEKIMTLLPTQKLYAVITDFPHEVQRRLLEKGVKIKGF